MLRRSSEAYIRHLASVSSLTEISEIDSQFITRKNKHCQTSNISRTLVDIKIVDHLDIVGASPVGAAPTASSTARRDGNRLNFGILCSLF